MARFFVLLILLGLAACNRPTQLVVDPAARSIGDIVPVFIGTTRVVDETGGIGSSRSEGLNFFRYDISVPPERTEGEIKQPGRYPDPATDFVATSAFSFPDQTQFERGLSAELRKRAPSERDAFIYVHGFNNTFSDGVVRQAQLAHDYKRPGVAIHYSWPSAGKPLSYEYDRDSVLFARDGLEELIYATKRAGANRIILIAHSMGTQLSMETMRQMAIQSPGSVAKIIDLVILISPDIDVFVFKTQARKIGELPSPFIIFVSEKDRALALSSLISGEDQRVGNIKSVHEIGDFDVEVIDVTEFSQGLGHDTFSNSPELIEFLSSIEPFSGAFRSASGGRVSLVDSFALSVRSATEIVLTPVEGILE